MSTNESLIDRLLQEKENRPGSNVVGTVKDWYQKNIGTDLPLSNVGATEFHKKLRLEHSRSFDVGLDPRTREGQRLIGFLDSQGIPYLAFDRAIPGSSTGPHIHVGPPSQRGGTAVAESESLVDRLLREKEQSVPETPFSQPLPTTPAQRRGAYGMRAQDIQKGRTDAKLVKLAHDINWHFGYSVLMAMPTLPEEKQREIVERSIQFAQEDEEKKARGVQIVESPLWKYRNQDLVGIREGKEIQVRQPPEVAAEMERQWKAYENPLMHLPNSIRRVAEAGISGAGGLLEVGAGVLKIAESNPLLRLKGTKPNIGGEFVAGQARKARGWAAESQDLSERSKATRIAQGVASGLIEFAPATLVPAAALETTLARIGALALTGGAYAGTQSVGRGSEKKTVARDAAVGAASFGLMGFPLPGKSLVMRQLSNLAIVGGGTTVINLATGQPLEDAAIHGLVQFGLNFPAAYRKIKVQEADGTERPATEADIKGLLPAARFEMETVDSRLPTTMTTKAEGAGRRFTQAPGQGELFSTVAPESRAAGRLEPPGLAPRPMTLEQFARSRGIEATEAAGEYSAYLERYKTTPASGKDTQAAFPLAGELGETQAAFGAGRKAPPEVVAGDFTLREVASMSPEQQQYKLAELLQQRRKAKNLSVQELAKIDRQISYLEQVVEHLPAGPEKGVVRLSEQTARTNLEMLKSLRDDKPAWNKLSPKQKGAIETQIKRYEEQSVGEISAVEPAKVGDRGRLRYTTREQLDPNKARLMHRERAVEETNVSRETSATESADQRVERLSNELTADRIKAFLKRETGSVPDLDDLRWWMTKGKGTQDLGNVERPRTEKASSVKAADDYVQGLRDEQEHYARLADDLTREQPKSDVIDLTGNDVDVRSKLKKFMEDEGGYVDISEIASAITKLKDEIRGSNRVIAYVLRLPNGDRLQTNLTVDANGKATFDMGRLVEGFVDMFTTEKANVGVDTLLALRRYIHQQHPEINRIDYSRVGSTGGVMGRRVNLPLQPHANTGQPPKPPRLSDIKHQLAQRQLTVQEIKGDLPTYSVVNQHGKEVAKFASSDRKRALQSLTQYAKRFFESEEGAFKPEELKKRLRELLAKNPDLTDVELKALIRNEGVEMRHAGVDPREAVRLADDLNRAGVKIDRGETQDFSIRDWIRKSPLSNLDFKGYFEQIAGETGKKVSDSFRNAQINMEDTGIKWEHEISAITQFTEKARKAAGTPRKEFYEKFIELIEKPLGSADRRSTSPELQQALEKHDTLTTAFKDYIIDSRKQLGIDMPANWGITDRGYFRHLFLGDIQLFIEKGGKREFLTTARTYAEAQKKALEVLKADPSANIEARPRTNFYHDPTVRLSSKKFWATVGNLTRSVRGKGGWLTKADILEDVKGIVGQKQNQQKLFGSLLHREGYGGYLKDYARVMEIHAQQLVRTQELTKLNKELQPLIEQMKAEGKPGLAEDAQLLLDNLWGKPSKFEMWFGNEIRRTPILRNYVANPDMTFRSLATRLTEAQRILRLDFNARASIVNALDPWATLWPYTTTKEFVSLYADYLKPSTRQMLRDKGVSQGATKLEAGTPVRGQKHRIPRPFQLASEMNRGIGYLYGLKDGTKKGLEGDALHRYGLEWAKKVEFDNSMWNVAPILRSPGARVLGQFKGYPLKQIEHIGTLARKKEGETKVQPTKRLGKFVGAKAVIGGAKAALSPVRVVAGYFGYENRLCTLKPVATKWNGER